MRKYFINCFNKIKNRNGKHEQNYRNESKKRTYYSTLTNMLALPYLKIYVDLQVRVGQNPLLVRLS